MGVNRREPGVLLRAAGCAGDAHAILVDEFSAGLPLVEKRADRHGGRYKERNSPARQPRRKIDQTRHTARIRNAYIR